MKQRIKDKKIKRNDLNATRGLQMSVLSATYDEKLICFDNIDFFLIHTIGYYLNKTREIRRIIRNSRMSLRQVFVQYMVSHL